MGTTYFIMFFGWVLILIQSTDALNNMGKTLHSTKKCTDPNQVLISSENNSWTCDCGPGFIYHRQTDLCYPPYRQGPCKKDFHLVYNENTKQTECSKNPCKEGFAKYNNICHELGHPSQNCKKDDMGSQIIDVNSTTLKIECISGADTLYLFDLGKQCNPGSKKDADGKCREEF